MKNLLNAGFYRLFRQKSTWVILILTLINTVIASFSCGLLFGNVPWIRDYYETAAEAMTQNGIDLMTIMNELPFTVETASEFTGFSILASSGLLLTPPILMAVFIAVYIKREQTFGFIKNLLPNISGKKIEGCSLIMILVFSTMMILVSAFAGLLLYGSYFDPHVPVRDPLRFLLYLITEVLLLFDVGVSALIICDLFRRPVFGTFFSVMYFIVGATLLYGLIDTLLYAVSGKQLLIETFTPFGCLSSLVYEDDQSLMRSGIASVLYAILFVLIRFYTVGTKEPKDMI